MQKDKAQVIKDECGVELAKALPALDDAVQALKTLKKKVSLPESLGECV